MAWGDESGSNAKLDPGTYILGAVILERRHVDEVRQAASELIRKGQHKRHWRDESAGSNKAIIETITKLPIENYVVVRANCVDDKIERRRRKCLEVFAPNLAAMGCENLTLESRGRAADKKDMDLLDAMRARHQMDSSFRLDHAAGPADPILWLADAVCGAVVADRSGDSQFLTALESRLTLEELG